MTAAKRKIAILGGGVSAMTVAWELTSAPDWRERFDSITVYQQGWRLGGKGASGRGLHGRIEEHGLHIWMGWYHNAFGMIRAAYEELGRPAASPLARWDDAFKRHGYINLGEQKPDGSWANWPLDFPLDDDTPGQGGEYPTVWDYVHETLQALHELLAGSLFTAPPALAPEHHGLLGLFERIEHGIERLFKVADELVDIVALELLLREARDHAGRLRAAGGSSVADRDPIAELMHRIRAKLIAHLESRIEHDVEARRLFCTVDIGLTCVAGVLGSGLPLGPRCLDALDTLDFRAFLRQHGALESSVTSSLVKAFYDLLFAYRDGDPDDQQVAAGVALRMIFRMTIGYKGAVFWKMQAGMGDTVFTPLHQVLERRGVRFEFFHAVRRLELSADRKRVERIHIGRQATLRSGTYQPYVDVRGLRCWPNGPLYDQLVEGDELRAQDIDLESFWTRWPDRDPPLVLDAGKDFDAVVFGISIASIPYVAAEPLAASQRWQACVAAVETVRTQAVQLWLTPTWKELGWTLPSAVSDTYPEPLDTWADMTHLRPREPWPAPIEPGSITYFCAPMRGGIPPRSDTGAPAREAAGVKASAIEWMERYAKIMWPNAAAAAGGFDWSKLADSSGATGAARFDSQFWRANIDPSERYVLSVPKSTAHRLHASDREFENLYVTGDWTYCGVNAGCVEAAVMSGKLTANALGGWPLLADIIGYDNP